MTKLEELKSKLRVALKDLIVAKYAPDEDCKCAEKTFWRATGAYKAELKKQQTAPREPVEDEGNPLV
jgi:hypothetical protein